MSTKFRDWRDFRHYLYLRLWFARYWLIHNLGARLYAKGRDLLGLTP